MKTAALLLLLLAQEDPSAWLERLRSDDVRERDAATRHLESLGLAAVERLQSLAGDDLEVKARLKAILATLKKRAELAKVFGPTKRVTASFKDRKLGEVLVELGKALDEAIDGVKIDSDRRINLDLKGATLWEALDALERTAGVRTEYGMTGVAVRPGTRADLPSRTVEQFRIGVGELKKMEHLSPGRSEQVGMVSIYVAYQRNLNPHSRRFEEGISIDSVVDGAGNDLKVDRVGWGRSWRISGHPFSQLSTVMVKPGKGPMTIEGTARMQFEVKSMDLSIPMAEGKRKLTHEGVRFEIKEVAALPTALSLRLEMEWDGDDPSERLKEHSIRMVDAKGKSYDGSWRGGGGGGNSSSSDLVFPGGIERPDRLIISWITEFHLVELPFRFEGLQLP
jgi:hypothetical protein